MNGVTILFVYAVIMILATVILTKKEKNVERFCVGSRSENWLMSALSIAATWIWAPALFVWPVLVSGSECPLSGDIHSLCKENPEGNARGNDTVWLHERKIPIRWSEKGLPVSADRTVCSVNRSSASCGKPDS